MLDGIFGDNAPIYIEKGWNTPLPLPHGRKKYPPKDVTGNVPDVDPNVIEGWLQSPGYHDANLGLRMPRIRRYEIIGIDIDQYGSKTGWDTIQNITAEIGGWPATIKSSHRGNDFDDPESVSGIYYFRVPAGKKWVGKVGSSIEIIQRTHRYSVVPPSQFHDIEGSGKLETYCWYSVSEVLAGSTPSSALLDEIPNVSVIPMLPSKWQDKLRKGEAIERSNFVETEIINSATARKWCSENFPGWDKLPSSEMARATDETVLSMDMTTGAHDAMVTRIHRIVRLGAEGHHGLREGLKRVYRAFASEVLGEIEDESARREIGEMKAEYDRALLGEIQNLHADIENGLAIISPIGGLSADDVHTDTSALQAQLAELARRRSREVTIEKNNDRGRSKMIREYWLEDLLPIEGSDRQFAQWDMIYNQFKILSVSDMYRAEELAVEVPLHERAVELYAEADALEANGDPQAKTVAKQAARMEERALKAGNKAVMDAAIAIAHSLPGPRVAITDFDHNPLTLGVANGVLDFGKWQEAESAGEFLRKGRPEDMIISNTGVPFEEHVICPEWIDFLETFLPNPEYRRFVQKVLGYCLLGDNPQRLIIFIQGKTSTGKTSFQDAIQSALGKDYCDFVASNALFRERPDIGPAPEVLKAMSRRIVFSSEVGIHNRFHADVIKRMTGGRDQVSARALYSNTIVSRVPAFTPIVATNSMPTITDGDSALWRRLLVLPFDTQVPEATVSRPSIGDAKYGPEAVLLWLVEGLLMYLREGLSPASWPEICHLRGQDFRVGTSDFQSFFHETIEAAPGEKIDAGQLYLAYKAWANLEGVSGHDVLTARAFGVKMASNGIAKQRTSTRLTKGAAPTSVTYFTDVRYRKPDETVE